MKIQRPEWVTFRTLIYRRSTEKVVPVIGLSSVTAASHSIHSTHYAPTQPEAVLVGGFGKQ
jgi:hypothetical protein